MECRRCPWWPTCEAELQRADDVSLVVRGEAAVALREVGVRTVAELAACDPAGEPPVPLAGPPFPDVVALARAWLRGLAVVRRVPEVPVLRADVEVDIDMESFGEAGAYMWGPAAVPRRRPAGRRAGGLPGVRHLGAGARRGRWPARSPSSGAGCPGARGRRGASGRTFAAYCYNEQAENRWLLASAGGSPAAPGIPPVAEVEEFIADPAGSTCTRWSTSGSCARTARASSGSPRSPGFAWRDPEAGGENSMRWYRDAVGMDGAPARPAQRQRLLEYNADDVAATRALREWMTSPAVLAVPLAADL
jgi:hypothetical protein